MPDPPFLLTVQSGKEAWRIHVEHKHAPGTQATTDASQHLYGVMTGHLGKTPEDKGHGVKYRLVLHGAHVSLHELDGQASFVCSAPGGSNSCRSEIKARHQRAAASHRQAVAPTATGNVQNALTSAYQPTRFQESHFP